MVDSLSHNGERVRRITVFITICNAVLWLGYIAQPRLAGQATPSRATQIKVVSGGDICEEAYATLLKEPQGWPVVESVSKRLVVHTLGAAGELRLNYENGDRVLLAAGDSQELAAVASAGGRMVVYTSNIAKCINSLYIIILYCTSVWLFVLMCRHILGGVAPTPGLTPTCHRPAGAGDEPKR